MVTKIIEVAKHTTRRNGKKIAPFWALNEQTEKIIDEKGLMRDDIVHCHWVCSHIPKHIKDILETAAENVNEWAVKKDKFQFVLKENLSPDSLGYIDHSKIFSICKLN